KRMCIAVELVQRHAIYHNRIPRVVFPKSEDSILGQSCTHVCERLQSIDRWNVVKHAIAKCERDVGGWSELLRSHQAHVKPRAPLLRDTEAFDRGIYRDHS